MDYTVIDDQAERGMFLVQLACGNVLKSIEYENALFSLYQRNDDEYTGGLWTMMQFNNGARAMVYDMESDRKIDVPAQQNYFKGEMTPLALSLALNMFVCSHMSFDAASGHAAQSFGENYQLLRVAIFNDESTCKEVPAIAGFLD